jgi:CheY-like chemotaxis protein
MDYTKATNGLKLVPHIETAALFESIALPLHVMNAMQGEKTRIELLPVPKKICSHIITDKQWLEENIMCLLSNAVKYSHKSIVTVSVSLIERQLKPLVEDLTSVEDSPCSPKLRIKPTIWSSWSVLTSPVVSMRGILAEKTPSLLLNTTQSDTDKVTSQKTSLYLRIEVADLGIGLSDEVMQSLFSPFKQAQRLAGGTGLGLFSMSRRVDAIGGRYGVMNRKDGQQGSVFWFEIPYKPDLEFSSNMTELSSTSRTVVSSFNIPHASTRKAAHQMTLLMNKNKTNISQGAEPHQRPLNILLVEDTVLIQKMTRMLLQKQGHTVTVAENGLDALNLITAQYLDCHVKREDRFDMVLMDFQMPVMDGLEATRRIRALETLLNADHSAGQPFHQLIIGLSANSDDETVQLARSEGMDDFMEKPFKAAVFNEICQLLVLPAI